jgi:hypothetical protein
MGCLLLYAYGVGVLLSRKMAQACERHLAFLAMGGADRPACRTISDFRPWHRAAFCDVCGAGLRIAAAAGLVPWGHVSTAGSKLPGNASWPKAMRDGYMQKDVERWRAALGVLGTQAFPQEAQPRWNASARAKSGVAAPPKRGTRRRMRKRSCAAPTPRGP